MNQNNELQQFPLQKSLNDLAIDKALKVIEDIGKSLPCTVKKVTGSILTVSFDLESSPWTLPMIDIPKAESNWIRMPTQVGDKGIAVPAGSYLGETSGMGTLPLNMQKNPGNLGALYFVPISNITSPPPNQNIALMQGVAGATMQVAPSGQQGEVTSSAAVSPQGVTINFGEMQITMDGTNGIKLTNGGTLTVGTSIVISAGGASINISSGSITLSAGGGTVTIGATGLSVNGTDFLTHIHGNGNQGGNTTPPIPGS